MATRIHGRTSARSALPLTAAEAWQTLGVDEAAKLGTDAVLTRLGSSRTGLTDAEAARRHQRVGPNAVRTRRVRWPVLLVRQVRSPLLLLLVVTAVVSFGLGERSDAVIIGLILAGSVLIGFVNEYRAALAAAALHQRVRHEATVIRDGGPESIDVVGLVPGDVVLLGLGAIVPADLRVIGADELECDEALITGESLAAEKSSTTAPAAAGAPAASGTPSTSAFMGTVVVAGSGRGVVVATGARTEFGRIVQDLGEEQGETEFQAGLRRFSGFLVRVALALSGLILVINVALARPVLDAVLFSLAIAVGITPQLLPAVVTTCLAVGSRRLAARGVLVKRLVCIEDLGDVELLLTDKTGTLTEGTIALAAALDPAGADSPRVLELGLAAALATAPEGTVAGVNPLDVALCAAPAARALVSAPAPVRAPLSVLPFDHERRMSSALLAGDPDGGHELVTRGAPESVLARCRDVGPGPRTVLQRQFEEGGRVIAVATRRLSASHADTDDERDLTLEGFLVFVDPPRADARAALERLARLDITVKVVTGDNPIVAEKVCRDLGLEVSGTMTGDEIARLTDDELARRIPSVRVFARVGPEQKARLVRLLRTEGRDVAFLGDGVNDAVALHAAAVGISVDSGADVAKDAADIVLLEKSLSVVADGVSEGRRTFANTIKYVLMGTSSNFGNMFSAAAASAFLSFLPMLPSQILLDNLLYDASQLAIPTDHVDPEMLARPSHWDLGLIRRFMLLFGAISSLFDFATFALMLGPFAAGPALFRSGWFVESLATQTLIVFVIRTRRVPFWRSRPSRGLLLAVLAALAVALALPYSPAAGPLGFTPLPAPFFVALCGVVLVYLALVELAKRRFFAAVPPPARHARTHDSRRRRRVRRMAGRFTVVPPRSKPSG